MLVSSKNVCKIGIHFDWQACDSRVKICVSPARWLGFALQGLKKTLEIYDFQSSESYQGGIHSSSFFLFSTLAVPERLWQSRTHSLQQGSVVTPCPAVGPCVPFFVHVLVFFCGASTEVDITWCPQFKHFAIWHNHFDNNVIYFLVITYTFSVNIYKSRQNNKFEPPPPPTPHPPWWSYDSMCNMLKTQKNQILYLHLRKPHFWNLQPFQGRRISRMPKTTVSKP